MKFTKKHFFILMGINLLLPFLIMAVFKRDNGPSFTEAMPVWFILVTVLSFLLFFIGWFLYYVITGGRDPSVKFHLLSQCILTLLIFSLFGYILFSRWYDRNYKANIYHNEFFLQASADGKITRYDTLCQKAFGLLQAKMNSRNDLWLEKRVNEAIDIRTDSTNEPVCIFYFVYSLKGKTMKYASGHMVGDHYNKLLFYNVPVVALPQLGE